MFVKMNATRHTKIGTLRAGVIYSGDQLGDKGRDVVEALLEQENPALVKLTKKQAAEEKAAVVSLVPEGAEIAAAVKAAADKVADDQAAADKAADNARVPSEAANT